MKNMKTIILCGGLGSRLSEETVVKPKPMVEIGNYPILWHILNIYSHYGYNDFVLALGYKANYIKDYFLNFRNRNSNITIELKSGNLSFSNTMVPNWNISMIDTGINSMTGGRLLRLKKFLKRERFMLTYGDGVSDINIKKLVEFHKSHGKLATVSAVRPTARFGGITIKQGKVQSFKEKPQTGEGWINGGFFIFEPEIFDYLEDDSTILEQSPLENLTKDKQLMAYEHQGYWQCMDTVRERDTLRELWDNNNAPWKLK